MVKKKDNPKEAVGKDIKKTLETLFSGILADGQKEIEATMPSLIGYFSGITEKDPEDFHYQFNYSIEGAMRYTIAKELKKDSYHEAVNSLVFLYTHYSFVDEFFTKLISKKEGMACSADKGRWLARSIGLYYAKGKAIDMTVDEKCYWKPHFWTDKQWLELFSSLQSFYCGNPSPFLSFMTENYVPLFKENAK